MRGSMQNIKNKVAAFQDTAIAMLHPAEGAPINSDAMQQIESQFLILKKELESISSTQKAEQDELTRAHTALHDCYHYCKKYWKHAQRTLPEGVSAADFRDEALAEIHAARSLWEHKKWINYYEKLHSLFGKINYCYYQTVRFTAADQQLINNVLKDLPQTGYEKLRKKITTVQTRIDSAIKKTLAFLEEQKQNLPYLISYTNDIHYKDLFLNGQLNEQVAQKLKNDLNFISFFRTAFRDLISMVSN